MEFATYYDRRYRKQVKIAIGTRGSKLALAQARLVEEAIRVVRPEVEIERKIITTTGDRPKNGDGKAGWKGLFTAEIERALIAGEVDVAVHSAKDLPSEMNANAEVAAVLPRAAVNDLLILKQHPAKVDRFIRPSLPALRDAAVVATSSVRRKYQLRWQRPDLIIVDVRGNVPTRVRKLVDNNWDAIVLARAGIDRLGISLDFHAESLPVNIFLPAGGQGIIALQTRRDDKQTRAIVDFVNHRETFLCLRAEREFLRLLNVDCNAPVGVLAQIENGKMKIRAQFFEIDMVAPREMEVEGEPEKGENLAAEIANRLHSGRLSS